MDVVRTSLEIGPNEIFPEAWGGFDCKDGRWLSFRLSIGRLKLGHVAKWNEGSRGLGVGARRVRRRISLTGAVVAGELDAVALALLSVLASCSRGDRGYRNDTHRSKPTASNASEWGHRWHDDGRQTHHLP